MTIDDIFDELVHLRRRRDELPRDAFGPRLDVATRRMELHAAAAQIARHRLG